MFYELFKGLFGGSKDLVTKKWAFLQLTLQLLGDLKTCYPLRRKGFEDLTAATFLQLDKLCTISPFYCGGCFGGSFTALYIVF